MGPYCATLPLPELNITDNFLSNRSVEEDSTGLEFPLVHKLVGHHVFQGMMEGSHVVYVCATDRWVAGARLGEPPCCESTSCQEERL